MEILVVGHYMECKYNLTNVNIQRKKYLYLMINLGNKIKKLREDARF